MKANYFAHDRLYREKLARGETGWDDPVQVRRTLGQLDDFLADVAFPPQPSMLEFGCGAGEVVLHFAAKGFTACGVDISPTAVEWARRKASDQGLTATFLVADITQDVNLPAPPVHLLVDGHCLHCIICPDRSAFLRNARKHLRADGVLCVDTMCGDPHYLGVQQRFDLRTRCVMIKDLATRYLGLPESILQEIRDRGFSVVKHQVITAVEDKDQDTLLVLAVSSQ